MTEPQMGPAKATALRKPFPKESVGVLPKPYNRDSPKGQCNECGGYHGLPAVHLDYVGHAAVTDRLLTVDPLWSWEPFALGPDGLPAIDRSGNLWIRLTICGVTRVGVGDGKNPKEMIGDAIRNAAMRFGVALDLWAKENLVEFAQAANHPPPARTPPTTDTRDDRPPIAPPDAQQPLLDEPPGEAEPPKWGSHAPMAAKTRGRMFALFTELKIPEESQLAGINHIIGKQLTSRGDLTDADAKRVIAKLEERKAGKAS